MTEKERATTRRWLGLENSDPPCDARRSVVWPVLQSCLSCRVSSAACYHGDIRPPLSIGPSVGGEVDRKASATEPFSSQTSAALRRSRPSPPSSHSHRHRRCRRCHRRGVSSRRCKTNPGLFRGGCVIFVGRPAGRGSVGPVGAGTALAAAVASGRHLVLRCWSGVIQSLLPTLKVCRIWLTSN